MICSESENFCRVFELPLEYPQGFCFNGGHNVNVKMVDWFNPVPQEMQDKTWDEVEGLLKDFLKEKVYVRKGFKYLVVTDFNKAFMFDTSQRNTQKS